MKNSLTKSKYAHVDRSKLTKEQRLELARQEKEEAKEKKGKGKKGHMTIDEILAQKKAEEDELRKKDTFQHLIEGGDFDHLSGDAQYHVRETEQTVEAISGVVGDLKSMAVQMSDTLDAQNAQIDAMTEHTVQTNVRMKKTRTKVRREF